MSRKIQILYVLLWGLSLSLSQSGCGRSDSPTQNSLSTKSSIDNALPIALIEQLRTTLINGDKEAYARLLDPRFQYREQCSGGLFSNDREEELALIGGIPEKHKLGLFDLFPIAALRFTFLTSWIEVGSDFPSAYVGDPAGHPDNDWFAVQVRAEIVLANDAGSNLFIDQIMTFKLRKDEHREWAIVQWVSEPMCSQLSLGPVLKVAHPSISWSDVKKSVQRHISGANVIRPYP